MEPASRLEGLTLSTGWLVKSRKQNPSSTGSCHSVGYIVERDGKEAFLKALDFSWAMNAPDPTRELQSLTSAFNFEKDLCFLCKDKRLRRVVHPIESDVVTVDPQSPIGRVPYIIFELASTDVRKLLDQLGAIDLAWYLRSIHQIFVAHQQLHSVDVAHQDLKPSNVMVFGANDSRLGDLGRASQLGVLGPFDHCDQPGDPAYAPPEHSYGFTHPDWRTRRFGCDSYLLGSMCSYFFVRTPMSALLKRYTPAHAWPTSWRGDYPTVLPLLERAHAQAIQEFSTAVPVSIRPELSRIVGELCHPNVAKRGDYSQNPGAPYSLERYISRFDFLARRAEHNLV